MKPASRGGPFVWLIVSQALGVLALLPWLAIAGLSFMAFDSGIHWQAVVFVAAICSYPLLLLGFSLGAWVCYRRGRIVAAMVLTSIPVGLGLAAGVLVFGSSLVVGMNLKSPL
jgi:hypothetical protein